MHVGSAARVQLGLGGLSRAHLVVLRTTSHELQAAHEMPREAVGQAQVRGSAAGLGWDACGRRAGLAALGSCRYRVSRRQPTAGYRLVYGRHRRTQGLVGVDDPCPRVSRACKV